MGFWDWLKGLFGGPKEIERDVTRLGGEKDELDEIAETVDLRGGPYRPNRLRLALRDRRLLPKKKKTFGKKKKVMEHEEADRLFAATLRTRNRNIRDLLVDEEQLKRYGLPLWRTEEELAAALELSTGMLRYYSIHREKERVPHYTTFSVAKRTGGRRIIMAPKKRLKVIQRRLQRQLGAALPKHEAAHGFVRGRSTCTTAEPHVKKKVVVRIDLEAFFPTITHVRVRGLLIALGYSYPVASTLAVLMTESERQPVELGGEVFHVPIGPRHCVQGAPTSPDISNAIVVRLDRRMTALAKRLGFVYTRYADDLIFSSNDPLKVPHLLGGARRIIAAEGFRVNSKKTRVARRTNKQVVTGVTVNDVLGLSKKERKKIRAAIHHAKHGKLDAKARASLEGKLAYLHGLNPEQAAKLRARHVLSP
jgi:hypothetical protein